MQVNVKDVAAGGVFIVIAGLFALGAQDLSVGTALRMGPGYFPLLLAGVLGLLGLIVLIKGLGKAPSPLGGVPWRGMVFILVAPIVFGLTVRGLGLAPAIALVIAISGFASRRASLLLVAALTVGLTIFCVLVFSYGLGLPLQLVGPWLRF